MSAETAKSTATSGAAAAASVSGGGGAADARTEPAVAVAAAAAADAEEEEEDCGIPPASPLLGVAAPGSPRPLDIGIQRYRARSFAGDQVISEFLTGRDMQQVRDEFFFEGRQDVSQSVRDNWILLLTDKEIQLTVRWVAHQINQRFVGQKIILTGILKGVFIFMKDLCTHLTIPYSCYFLEASSYVGQEQSESVIFSSKINKAKFAGHRIVLLDELFDNGKTLYHVAKALREELECEASDIFTCCLFSKKKEPEFPKPDLVGFDQFPDVWLVGYGLDDGGEKRGWPHIFGLPKLPGMQEGEADVLFAKNKEAAKYLCEVRQQFRQKLTRVAASF